MVSWCFIVSGRDDGTLDLSACKLGPVLDTSWYCMRHYGTVKIAKTSTFWSLWVAVFAMLVRKWIVGFFWGDRFSFQRTDDIPNVADWLVLWNIFYFPVYWEYSSQLTNIFQRGWNHQLDMIHDYMWWSCFDHDAFGYCRNESEAARAGAVWWTSAKLCWQKRVTPWRSHRTWWSWWVHGALDGISPSKKPKKWV